MINPALIPFLRELAQNNNKAWFEEHRAEYKALRMEFVEFLQTVAEQIAFFDPAVQLRLDEPKLVKTFRINRDIRFSNDKSPYKTNFSGTIGAGQDEGRPLYYVSIEPGASAIGGGIYMPPSALLQRLRKKIDVDYKSLQKIINSQAFKAAFPHGLTQEGALKTAPRGYDIDHPAIELLRLKSFAALRSFSDEEVTREDFSDEALKSFEALSKLNAYLDFDRP